MRLISKMTQSIMGNYWIFFFFQSTLLPHVMTSPCVVIPAYALNLGSGCLLTTTFWIVVFSRNLSKKKHEKYFEPKKVKLLRQIFFYINTCTFSLSKKKKKISIFRVMWGIRYLRFPIQMSQNSFSQICAYR